MGNGEQTADNQAVSMRVLNFPPDRSIGTLYRYVLYEGKSTMRILKEMGPARGAVTVPRTHRRGYRPVNLTVPVRDSLNSIQAQ